MDDFLFDSDAMEWYWDNGGWVLHTKFCGHLSYTEVSYEVACDPDQAAAELREAYPDLLPSEVEELARRAKYIWEESRALKGWWEDAARHYHYGRFPQAERALAFAKEIEARHETRGCTDHLLRIYRSETLRQYADYVRWLAELGDNIYPRGPLHPVDYVSWCEMGPQRPRKPDHSLAGSPPSLH